LPSLFARFSEVLGSRADLEVIFVDNGSTDNSAAVIAHELERPGQPFSFVRIVTVPVNQGYGHGIWAGLEAARGEFVGWTHADSQYDPKIVLEGFDRLAAAPEPARSFLQGRRVGRNLFDAFFTAGMTVVARILLGIEIRDINAQPKLFPRTFLSRMQNPPKDFSLDLYALFIARRHGCKLLYLPVVFGRRLHGEAKGGGSLSLKWKLTKRTWNFMWQLRRNIRQGRL
jgi:glycosyltransferase involved in cell wall biosynthesis